MSYMDNIQRNSFTKLPIIVIHGDAGVGKTTFAAQSDGIFIIAEDGLGILPVAHFPKPETALEVNAQLQELIHHVPKEGEKHFQWLVVDSITALEKKVWSDICAEDKVKSIEEVGGGFGKGYTKALEWMDKFIRNLQALRDKRGMGIILIAHTKIQTINPPDKAAYDQYVININKKVAEYIHTQADIVAYCELEQLIKQEEQGFGRTQGTAVETGKRIMHCYSSKKYTSKNRYGIQAPMNMDLNLLMNTIVANAPQPQQ